MPTALLIFSKFKENACFFIFLTPGIPVHSPTVYRIDAPVAEEMVIFDWKKCFLKRNLEDDVQFYDNCLFDILTIYDKFLFDQVLISDKLMFCFNWACFQNEDITSWRNGLILLKIGPFQA